MLISRLSFSLSFYIIACHRGAPLIYSRHSILESFPDLTSLTICLEELLKRSGKFRKVLQRRLDHDTTKARTSFAARAN